MKVIPSAAATLAVAAPLAIAAPLALAGLPGARVLTLGISGEGSPRAGHAYTYLVSVNDPARAPGWLVHLDISAPAGTTVVAASGACRTGAGGASCVWPQVTGGSSVAVEVTVSLAVGLSPGTALAATARLSYDWGQLSTAATSVRTVTSPPRPKVKPKPRPRPTHVPHPPLPGRPAPVAPLVTSQPSSPPGRVAPASTPSLGAGGTQLRPVRPAGKAVPSRTPPLSPPRSPSARPFLPRAASQLIHPPPSQPARGLPKGLLIALIIAPCVAAAVTRFARGR